MNSDMVLSTIMKVCRAHGLSVMTPQDLPGVITEALSGRPVLHSREESQPVQARGVVMMFEFGSPEDEEDPWEDDGGLPDPAQLEDHLPEEVNDDMIAAFERKQQALIQRVAERGVSYRNNANPAMQGKRLAPHPSVGQPRRGGEDDLFEDPEDEEDDFSRGGSSSDSGGPLNAKTGLTLEQQRAIIARSTGKAPEPPKAGRPNTMRR